VDAQNQLNSAVKAALEQIGDATKQLACRERSVLVSINPDLWPVGQIIEVSATCLPPPPSTGLSAESLREWASEYELAA